MDSSHLIHSSLSPMNQPPNAFQWGGLPPIAPSSWGSGVPSNTMFIESTHVSHPQLVWFSHFCRVHKRDQQTDRQTDRRTDIHTDQSHYSVCSNSRQLMQCVRWETQHSHKRLEHRINTHSPKSMSSIVAFAPSTITVLTLTLDTHSPKSMYSIVAFAPSTITFLTLTLIL